MPEITGGCYRHLTYDDRCEIQRMLGAGESVSPVARSLGRNVSSITREIVRNRRDDGYRSTPAAMVRLCTHVRTCGLKGICPRCSTRRCASCSRVRCTNISPRFTPEVCERTAAAPFVCDGCASINGCRLHRYRYGAKLAEHKADARLRESRAGIDTTSEAFEAMISTAKPLICEQGQSIAHVWAAHEDEFPCSGRTFYRYVDAGFGGLKNLDLVAKCRYRPRKGKRPHERFFIPGGRTYAGFMSLPEDERLSVIEIDCVEGVRTDTKVLLTMLSSAHRSCSSSCSMSTHRRVWRRSSTVSSPFSKTGSRRPSLSCSRIADTSSRTPHGSSGVDAPASTTATPGVPTRRARSRTATACAAASSPRAPRSITSRDETPRSSQATWTRCRAPRSEGPPRSTLPVTCCPRSCWRGWAWSTSRLTAWCSGPASSLAKTSATED